MHRDANHPDYQRGTLEEIDLRARELAPTPDPNEPHIPAAILDILQRDDADEPFAGIDTPLNKPATPADRPVHSTADLETQMERARPQALVPQRDSDCNKNVEGARVNAFDQISSLRLRTGSVLD